MKLLAALVLFASFSAQASDTYFTIERASFSTMSKSKVHNLFVALIEAGATKAQDGTIRIPNMLVHWRTNSKDFLDKTDVCYERPSYYIRFKDAGSNKWITLNDNRDCVGAENQKSLNIVHALHDLGFDKVAGDAAMGGQRDQTVTDLSVSQKATDGADGTFGAELTEEPPQG